MDTTSIFDSVPEKPHPVWNGWQRLYEFDNGYGASVVSAKNPTISESWSMFGGSYGHEQGLMELAVIGPDGDLDYSTPIADDVVGNLNKADVERYLRQISELPSKEQTNAR